MKILLVSGSVILPLLMFYLEKKTLRLRNIYNFIAILAILVFGNIASLSIYNIIKNERVFMTDIHAIFLNPFFLISGAYLGVYIIYRLLLLSVVKQRIG